MVAPHNLKSWRDIAFNFHCEIRGGPIYKAVEYCQKEETRDGAQIEEGAPQPDRSGQAGFALVLSARLVSPLGLSRDLPTRIVPLEDHVEIFRSAFSHEDMESD